MFPRISSSILKIFILIPKRTSMGTSSQPEVIRSNATFPFLLSRLEEVENSNDCLAVNTMPLKHQSTQCGRYDLKGVFLRSYTRTNLILAMDSWKQELATLSSKIFPLNHCQMLDGKHH